MAYGDKYYIDFMDWEGREYRVKIAPTDWVGGQTDLTPTDEPIVINWKAEDDKFFRASGSECVLKCYSGGLDLSDLFVVDPYGILMTVEALKNGDYHRVWTGFVNPEVFSEDWTGQEEDISITANDGLGAMKRKSYFLESEIFDDGLVLNPAELLPMKVTDVIKKCMMDIPVMAYHFAVDIRSGVDDFTAHQLDQANFVDEDLKGKTRRDVIDWICQTYSVNFRIVGSVGWFYDPCLLADAKLAPTAFITYDGDMVRTPLNDFTTDLVWDISTKADISYTAADHLLEYRAGFEKISTDYSPYPLLAKLNRCSKLLSYEPDSYGPVVPWTGTDGVIPPFTSQAVRGVQLTANQETRLGIEVTGADNPYAVFDALERTGTGYDDPDRYVGVINYTSIPPQAYGNPSVKMKGGWLPVTTDQIKVTFKTAFLHNLGSPPVGNHSRVRIPFIMKIGGKYATGGIPYANITDVPNINANSNAVTFDSTTQETICLDIINNDNQTNNANRTGADFSFTIDGIQEAGILEIWICNDNRIFVLNEDSSAYDTTWWYQSEWAFGVKDVGAVINGVALDEDSVETEGSTNIEFANSTDIDLNISTKRQNGCLDAGGLINSLDEHEIFAYRQSYTINTTGSGAVIQGFLGNYREKYRALSGTFKVNQMLRNITDMNVGQEDEFLPIDNVFTPLAVLTDDTKGLTSPMMLTDTTWDLKFNEVEGTWVQLFNADVNSLT